MPDPKSTFTNEIEIRIDGVRVISSVNRNLGACWVECSMNLPTAFHLMFTDNYQEYLKLDAAQFRLGARVEVSAVVDGHGGDVPLVTGEITGIETDYDGGTTSVVIRGLDHAFKMMRRRRTKGYKDQTATAIVRKLAEQDGVMVGPDVEDSLARYDLITQPNISDWQFANELAARSGMFVDFDNRGLLRFRRLPRARVPENPEFAELPTVLQVGANVHRCRTGVTAMDQAGSVTVRGWDTEENSKLTSTMEAVTYHGRVITADPVDALAVGAPSPYVETGTPYGSEAEVAAAANALAEDISAVFAELEVLASGNPALMPGRTVELKGAGASFDGLYTVTTARHEFGAKGDYLTWVTVTGRQVRNLYGLAAGASGPSVRIPGVVNALVTDINDPADKGRVMVKFPWLDDDYQSRWARTLQFGGKGGGGVIIPAVGDEVLVAFDRGDVNYPYVLGGLYGNRTRLPSPHDVDLVTAGHLNRQSLVSRAGHRLELLDAATARGVRLQSGDKNLTLYLDQTEKQITISSSAGPAGGISVPGGSTISVDADGSVTITCTGGVSVKAPKVTIDADVSITGALNVTGPTSVTGPLNQSAGPVEFAAATFSVDVIGATEIIGGVVQIQGVPAPYLPMPA